MKLNINNNTLEKIDWDQLDKNEIKLIHRAMDYLSFNPVGIEPISKESNQDPNEQYLLAMYKNVFSEEEKYNLRGCLPFALPPITINPYQVVSMLMLMTANCSRSYL